MFFKFWIFLTFQMEEEHFFNIMMRNLPFKYISSRLSILWGNYVAMTPPKITTEKLIMHINLTSRPCIFFEFICVTLSKNKNTERNESRKKNVLPIPNSRSSMLIRERDSNISKCKTLCWNITRWWTSGCGKWYLIPKISPFQR